MTQRGQDGELLDVLVVGGGTAGVVAGIQAALAAAGGLRPADVPFARLRKLLLEHGAILPEAGETPQSR